MKVLSLLIFITLIQSCSSIGYNGQVEIPDECLQAYQVKMDSLDHALADTLIQLYQYNIAKKKLVAEFNQCVDANQE